MKFYVNQHPQHNWTLSSFYSYHIIPMNIAWRKHDIRAITKHNLFVLGV